ncbi:MAG TPA: hypothetical protein VIW29_07945, partial [Polyangiaceae bacterium]
MPLVPLVPLVPLAPAFALPLAPAFALPLAPAPCSHRQPVALLAADETSHTNPIGHVAPSPQVSG